MGSRIVTSLLAASLLVVASGGKAVTTSTGPWVESRFQTGCEPGPVGPPPPPEHVQTHYPPLREVAEPVSLRVMLDAPSARPLTGMGLNLEHALWSCPAFRGLFRSEILDPFKPTIARLDSGLLPAAPPDIRAEDLHPAVYESVLLSAPYTDSWRFFRRLNRAGVKIILGVWGGPAQFTYDGTRLGVLQPRHYGDYAEYVATVVEFLVHQQNIDIWATTIANEPDGGDGNQIPPYGLAYIARQLGPRLAASGVRLYGPDTATAADTLEYLPVLLDDPDVAPYLAFVGFHQYEPSEDVEAVVQLAHSRRPDLPVIVTEYTSFFFGDLDAGQEANAQNGFTLDAARTLLAHYRAGVDAAIYWDAVDYLQPGHDAITRWGLLRGPGDDFARRQRYYGFSQILPYLQPGARVLEVQQEGSAALDSLAVLTPERVPVVFLVNQEFAPIDLTLTFDSLTDNDTRPLVVTTTGHGQHAERVGRVSLSQGTGRLTLPARSITTLTPSGTAPVTDADEASG